MKTEFNVNDHSRSYVRVTFYLNIPNIPINSSEKSPFSTAIVWSQPFPKNSANIHINPYRQKL